LNVVADVVRVAQLGLVPGNSGVLSLVQARNELWECRGEIRIVRAPISRPRARVDGELHEIGQPADLGSAGRSAAWQAPELVQVDYRCTLRGQVGVDERLMADLIVGVVRDVLRHVAIEHAQSGKVSGVLI